MIEITGRKNRIVFEGVVFDVEHKVTRTGRVLISFKMTDAIPPSFSLQKWVKNEELKFDMIKKNSWLRCGNIKWTISHRDLTMNVKTSRKSCTTPWDLMPEGRRVEFHAQHQYVDYGCSAGSRKLIAKAAEWGIRPWPSPTIMCKASAWL